MKAGRGNKDRESIYGELKSREHHFGKKQNTAHAAGFIDEMKRVRETSFLNAKTAGYLLCGIGLMCMMIPIERTNTLTAWLGCLLCIQGIQQYMQPYLFVKEGTKFVPVYKKLEFVPVTKQEIRSVQLGCMSRLCIRACGAAFVIQQAVSFLNHSFGLLSVLFGAACKYNLKEHIPVHRNQADTGRTGIARLPYAVQTIETAAAIIAVKHPAHRRHKAGQQRECPQRKQNRRHKARTDILLSPVHGRKQDICRPGRIFLRKHGRQRRHQKNAAHNARDAKLHAEYTPAPVIRNFRLNPRVFTHAPQLCPGNRKCARGLLQIAPTVNIAVTQPVAEKQPA